MMFLSRNIENFTNLVIWRIVEQIEIMLISTNPLVTCHVISCQSCKMHTKDEHDRTIKQKFKCM